jgi:hypothetical protein
LCIYSIGFKQNSKKGKSFDCHGSLWYMTVQSVYVPERMNECKVDPMLAKFVSTLYHLIVKYVKLHNMIV